jgi:Leucine-rich repeat (LRR) protein
MTITITYINNDIKKYDLFEEIENHNLVLIIDCSNNMLTGLPANMNFPNLQEFNCSNNQLTGLPANMNFPNLQEFCCSRNQLTGLPANMNFPNLQKFSCSNNMLKLLPTCILNFKNLHQIKYQNNMIELSLQMECFINSIQNSNYDTEALTIMT